MQGSGTGAPATCSWRPRGSSMWIACARGGPRAEAPSEPLHDISLGLRPCRGVGRQPAPLSSQAPCLALAACHCLQANGYGGKSLRLNLVPAVLQESRGGAASGVGRAHLYQREGCPCHARGRSGRRQRHYRLWVPVVAPGSAPFVRTSWFSTEKARVPKPLWVLGKAEALVTLGGSPKPPLL